MKSLLTKHNTLSVHKISIPKIHGLLLFREKDDLKSFLKEHFKDIHIMTGDIMHIYYNKDDLKRNVSAYERIKKMHNFGLESSSFPSLVVWSEFGGQVEEIGLAGLDHEDVFRVIEFLVKQIDTNDFDIAVKESRKNVQSIILEKRPVTYNYNVNGGLNQIIGFGKGNEIKVQKC